MPIIQIKVKQVSAARPSLKAEKNGGYLNLGIFSYKGNLERK